MKIPYFFVFLLIPIAVLASHEPIIKTDEPTEPTVMGNARFTVITPTCIRIEYSGQRRFVDQSTLFAINRSARCADAKITKSDKVVRIDTGKMQLTYTANGKEFNSTNLRVKFKNNGRDAEWNAEAKNTGNLGGPVPTLDGWSGPKQVTDGLLSRDGWYLLDDTGRAILTDRGITQRPGGWPQGSGRQAFVTPDSDWYLFAYGDDYRAALQSLSVISGKSAMPRRHVFGSWYCRWFNYTSDQFRQIVQEYKDHDFPMDILVMDMGWHTQADAQTGYGHGQKLGWTGYTWNKELIPDPAKLLGDLKSDGIYVVLNDHPADGMREHEENYPQFIKMLPAGTPANPPFNAGSPDYMQAFFKTALEPLEKQGVDFWWVDWQQDYIYNSVYGVPGLKHLPWLNKLYFDHSAKGDRRGQGFSRWGGWGDHRHPIQFSGDTQATWEMLAFEIPFTANSGNAGCFFWAHDLGGFSGERNPEMFTRWVQFGALSSSLRVHSTGGKLDRRPWLWGDQFEQSMRGAYHLRAQLLPYIYTSVRQCYDQTLPLVRPMYIDYPSSEDAYNNPQQYMFGDNLLAAPVVSPGTGPTLVAEQKVWFPEGTWYNFMNGEKFAGGATVRVKAAIDGIPLYAKAGVPIPLQPYTQRMTTTALTTLIVRCFPGDSGASSLYEDDGQSNGYMKSECSTTALNYQRHDNLVSVRIGSAQGRYAGQPLERIYRIELPSTTQAINASVNGKPVVVEYDNAHAMNIITTPPIPLTQSLEFVIKTGEKK